MWNIWIKCPIWKGFLIGVHAKVNSKNKNGRRPRMILATCNLQTLKVSEEYSFRDNYHGSLNHFYNPPVASHMLDSINLTNELPVTVNSAKLVLLALWLRLAPPTQEIELIGKWFVRIYKVWKKVFPVLGGLPKGSCLTVTGNQHILNQTAQGYSGYIERICPYHRFPDTWYNSNDIRYTIYQQR